MNKKQKKIFSKNIIKLIIQKYLKLQKSYYCLCYNRTLRKELITKICINIKPLTNSGFSLFKMKLIILWKLVSFYNLQLNFYYKLSTLI